MAYRDLGVVPEDFQHAPARESREGHDEAVFVRLPTDFEPVRVGDAELKGALVSLVLDMPLRVASSSSVSPGGLAPGSGGSGVEGGQSELARSYRGFCARCGTPGDCFSLLGDGPHLQADDKQQLALALAVGPALEGVDAGIRAMLDPTRVLATVSFTLTAYMALLVAPDPVVTKGVAAAFTVLMWGYLGSQFFDLIRAYVRLREEAAQATTFAELREVGERFGRVIGPNSVRILVLLGTAAIGETSQLAARLPKLPGVGQVSRTIESSAGLRLDGAAVGIDRIIVSTNEGTLRAVVPMTAMAMAARNGGGDSSASGAGGTPKEGKLLPNGHRAFKSFDDLKDFMGSAGEGKQWHHIVEQRKVNVERFGAEAIHNTENVVAVKKSVHEEISAIYSTRSDETGGMVVREWLRTQSYETQRAFGLSILRPFGVIQ